MPHRLVKILNFVLIFVALNTLTACNINKLWHKNIDFHLRHTAIKQGEFFIVSIMTNKEAYVNFNSHSYPTFAINKNKRVGYVPVENLLKPGLYFLSVSVEKNLKETLVRVFDNGKKISYVTLDPNRLTLNYTEEEKVTKKKAYATVSPEKLWSKPFIYPNKARKSTPYGIKRSYNGGPVKRYHQGVDFAASLGDAIRASNVGKVIYINQRADAPSGKLIIIDHGRGITSTYMHIKEFNVELGDIVEQNDIIAKVGNTGVSSGPHLHWEMHVNGEDVDPEFFIANNIP